MAPVATPLTMKGRKWLTRRPPSGTARGRAVRGPPPQLRLGIAPWLRLGRRVALALQASARHAVARGGAGVDLAEGPVVELVHPEARNLRRRLALGERDLLREEPVEI